MAPQPGARERYAGPLARYAALYPALSPLFHGDPEAAAAGQAKGGDTAAASGPGPSGRAGPHAVASEPAAHGHAGAATPHSEPCTSFLGAAPPRPVLLAPSLLSADFADLRGALRAAQSAGCAWVHVDAFDGSWPACPNWTLGPPVLASLRAAAPEAFLDVHLAVAQPGRWLEALAAAGASGVSAHWEVLRGGGAEAAELVGRVRALGMRAGLALAVDTPLPVRGGAGVGGVGWRGHGWPAGWRR